MTEKLPEIILETRPYQNEALFAISSFVKNILRGVEDEDREALFKNSAFLNMATGSGKTFTIGKALENIIKLRNRYNGINHKKEFDNLNIVTFTHRIDLINQFRDDLVVGRDGKKSIISDEIIENFDISTHNSKVKKKKKKLNSESEKDNIIFTTHQTAKTDRLIDNLDYVDIILVDELHNVKKDSDYFRTIQEFAKKGRNGKQAIIIGVTATPNNHTRELFGEEIFDYGLEKYLNSIYSPSVEYNLVTNSKANKEIIKKLQGLIELAKNTQDFSEKKELIKEAEDLFIEIMASFNDDEELVDDLIERVGNNGEMGETVIFCDSIEKVDSLAEIINKKLGQTDIALSFHSKNDKNKALDRLKDKNDNCKIVLAVGKLNEGIDLPKVENVVFWRGTDSETIFFQQFGRGLRGEDLVRYFDYVGGIKNFAWINKIYKKYNRIKKESEKQNNGAERTSKFNLLGGDTGINEHNINLADLGLGIVNVKEEFNISKEEAINYFKTIKGNEDDSYEYWMNYGKNEILGINHKGNRISDFKNIININFKGDIYKIIIFREFINKIFGKKKESEEKYSFSKDKIIEYFKIIKSTEQKSYEYLLGLSKKDFIKEIEYKGKKIFYLYNVFYPEAKGRYLTELEIKNFVRMVFGKEKITKNMVVKYFKEKKGNIKKSYEYWKGFKRPDILNISYEGFNYQLLRKILFPELIGDSTNVALYKKFIIMVFEEDDVVEKNDIFDIEKVIEYFKTYNGTEKKCSVEESYEYWMSFGHNEIKELKYYGIGIVALKNIVYPELVGNIETIGIFRKFISKIFENEKINKENIPNTKENIIKYFKTYNGDDSICLLFSEKECYEYWINFNIKKIRTFNYNGKGITALKNIVYPDFKGNIYSKRVFKKFIKKIFEDEDL